MMSDTTASLKKTAINEDHILLKAVVLQQALIGGKVIRTIF